MDNLPMEPITQLDEMDLTNVEAHRPIIKESTVEVRLTEIMVKDSKDKQSKNAEFTFVTETKCTGTNGKEIMPGHKHTETVSLKATDKYDPQARLAQIQLCFTGKQGKWHTDEVKGKTGLVRFGIEKSDEYGERNRIREFKPKKSESQVLS